MSANARCCPEDSGCCTPTGCSADECCATTNCCGATTTLECTLGGGTCADYTGTCHLVFSNCCESTVPDGGCEYGLDWDDCTPPENGGGGGGGGGP